MVSHSSTTLREYCTSGIVLEKGEATYYSDLEEAIIQHDENNDKVMLKPFEDRSASADDLFLEGRRSYKRGDDVRAEKYISLALAEQPDNVEWISVLGRIQLRLGNKDEALRQFNRANRLSDNVKHLIEVAETLQALGREDEAEEVLRSALDGDCMTLTAAFALGRLLYRNGQLDEAEMLLRQVIEGEPRHAQAHRILALIYSKLKKYPEALFYHAAAAELMPHHSAYLLSLARLEARVGQADNARAIYSRILALHPENQEAKSYLKNEC